MPAERCDIWTPREDFSAEAMLSYEKAAHINPVSALRLLINLVFFSCNGNSSQANGEVFNNWGALCYQQERIQEAAAHLKSAAALKPNVASIRKNYEVIRGLLPP